MAAILEYNDSAYRAIANNNQTIIAVFETKPKAAIDRFALDLPSKPSYIADKVDPMVGRVMRDGEVV